jgi:hypothetical protein
MGGGHIALTGILHAVISVTEVKGGSSLEGAGKGRLWRKGSRKGVDRGAQRALIPSFLPVNVLVNLIPVNQMDPYDSDRSGGGSEFPSQSTTTPPSFNDPNYETYKHGQQFINYYSVIEDCT